MFKRVLFRGAVCLALAAGSLMAHDPHDPIVTVAVSPNFAQDSTVFAATDYLSVKLGIYALMKSTNAGVTWSAIAGLPTPQEMWSIAFSPAYAKDQTIFVASSGGLYVTTNQGTTWTLASSLSLVNVAVSPEFATDNTLFVVTSNMTVYESTNRGQTLTQITLPASINSALSVIAVSPNFDADGTLLLGTASNGIYGTNSGGASWTAIPGTGTAAVTALAFSPDYISDRTAFAGTAAGVLISTTAGASWTASNTGLTDTNINSVTLSPTYLQDSTIWVCAAVGGVFQSTNQGASWAATPLINRVLSPLTTSHYHNVAAGPGAGGTTLILAAFEGLWSSPASSISWQYIDSMPTRLVRHLLLSPNYTHDKTIFANTYGGGNLWSTSGGASWAYQNTGMILPYTDAAALSPDFAADGTAFSSVNGHLEQSVNHGSTWQEMAQLGEPTNARGLAVSPNFTNDKTVLIGTNNDPNPTLPPYVTYMGKQYPNQGLFISLDGGNNWIPTSLGGPPMTVVAISPNFANDKTAFAGTANKGLFKSTDGGNTWTNVPMPHPSITQIGVIAFSPGFATDLTIFMAPITGALLKSTDGGNTWAVLSHTANLLVLDLQLSPNYLSDQTFYAATVQGGVMKSTNGGNSIVPLASFPDQFATAVGLSPNFTNDQTLFAAAYHSIYKSINAGSTWTDTVEPGRIEESRTVDSTNTVGQPPPTITYLGSWTSTSATNASTSAYMSTTTAQNTATLNFTGTGVEWVSPMGPHEGSATVTVDGVLQATVNLQSATPKFQQKVWQQQGMPCAPHTVTITATGASVVTLDAFDVWINACPEAN